MEKQEQFLWIVQTAFLANAINISLNEDAKERRAEFSASGALIFMDEAVRASGMIPARMSAFEAANEFAGWALDSLREEGDKLPAWFAR